MVLLRKLVSLYMSIAEAIVQIPWASAPSASTSSMGRTGHLAYTLSLFLSQLLDLRLCGRWSKRGRHKAQPIEGTHSCASVGQMSHGASPPSSTQLFQLVHTRVCF